MAQEVVDYMKNDSLKSALGCILNIHLAELLGNMLGRALVGL